MIHKQIRFPAVVVAASLLTCFGASPAGATNPIFNFGSSVANGTDYCLGIAGGVAADGAHAVQGPCTFDESQLWTSWPYPGVWNGNVLYVQLRNVYGKCLGLAGGSTTSGTHVVQGPCVDPIDDNDFTQSWTVDAIWTTNGHAVTRWRNLAANRCMGIAGGSHSSGTHVVIGTCGDDASDTRRWYSPNP